eukprot:6236-Heterococcus_DN1.PRE.2
MQHGHVVVDDSDTSAKQAPVVQYLQYKNTQVQAIMEAMLSCLYEKATALVNHSDSVTQLIYVKKHRRAIYRLQRDLVTTAKDFYADKKMFLASIGNDVPPFVCRYSNDDSSISHVTNAAQQWTIDNAIPYECTLTQCATPEIVETTASSADALVMQIVTSDSMHYSGGFRAHDRVLRIFRNDFFEDQSKLELHVSTATIDLIKTQYIAPMKQRRQLLVQTLQQPPEHVSLEAMLDKHIQELVYLSPVFIPIDDVNHKTTHAITCDTYNNGSDSGTATTTIDESKHPHIVFYIIPYNRGPFTTASTASAVLCGKRGDDKLTFVITVPKDLALHLDTSAVASLITKWLSKYADFKLDMFLLPDNWSSWRRQSALLSTECR